MLNRTKLKHVKSSVIGPLVNFFNLNFILVSDLHRPFFFVTDILTYFQTRNKWVNEQI